MASATENLLLPSDLMARLERLELATRRIFRGRMKGERRSRRKGQSVEFADFRNYVPGDDLRQIDWNLYARLEKLILKLFMEEEDLHFYTLIDASVSMSFGEPTKLLYAKQIAAALGYIGLIRADRVKVESLGQGLKNRGRVLRGRSSASKMLDQLAAIEPTESSSLLDGVRNFSLRNRGNGILVLITDLMDKSGYEAALKFLSTRRMDVYVIQVLSQEEINPEITGDLKLVDAEDQDIAEISVSAPLLARYQKTLASFVGGAQEFCTRRGMGYILANNQMPVHELVANYLRRQGLVK